MKGVTILTAFLLASTCGTMQTEEPAVFRTLHAGAFGSGGTGLPQATLIADEASYRNAWQAHSRGASPPAVDFSKESVVFLFAGERPTGGYSVAPVSVAVEGEVARIVAEIKGPPAGAMVTQALTYPYAVIAVAKPNLRRVEWVDRDGRRIAAEIRGVRR